MLILEKKNLKWVEKITKNHQSILMTALKTPQRYKVIIPKYFINLFLICFKFYLEYCSDDEYTSIEQNHDDEVIIFALTCHSGCPRKNAALLG